MGATRKHGMLDSSLTSEPHPVL